MKAPKCSHRRALGTIPDGFTLTETVLVIAIVGILVALTLPSLGSVRRAAQDIRAQSDLRQHVAVFAAYASDADDCFPYFADPRASETVIRSSQGAVAFHYFNSSTFWPHALVDSYYGGIGLESDVFRSPYIREEEAYDTVYVYSCSLIASPLYWDPATRTGRDQLVAQRVSNVRFPSQKAVLSADPWILDRSPRAVLEADGVQSATSLIASSDGAARGVTVGTLGASVRTGDGSPPGFGVGGHLIGWRPSGAHTLHGSGGRDLP